MFDWAEFGTAKGGIKLHKSWDYNLMIPDVVNITEAKVYDRYGLKQLIYPMDTIIIEDRAYFDFWTNARPDKCGKRIRYQDQVQHFV